MPSLLIFKWRHATAPICWFFARPQESPFAALRRCYQRLGKRAAMDVRTVIDEHQPVVAVIAEKSEHERFRSQNRAVQRMRFLLTEHGIAAPQRKEITMQCHRIRMAVEFTPIQFAFREGGSIAWRRYVLRHDIGKLCEKFPPPA